MKHSFSKSLEVGKAGELAFMELWPGLERLDGRTHDFFSPSSGKTIELKTDSYDMNKTANFFIELWSDLEQEKVGGPWQARKNATDLWIYYFRQNQTAFEFNVAELAEWTDKNHAAYKPVHIFNPSWVTAGIKVPREALAFLYIELKSTASRVGETK